MRSHLAVCLALFPGIVGGRVWAGPPETDEDSRRQAAIAEFSAKMKAANYPGLFELAAQEFGVPADILKGVAFAETRWDQLMWPPGETASPDTGMPRPYGIMSLWDNQYFGHSLLEAAALIGKTPDELKQDAFQNIRGGAALLRTLYDENPKPEGTTETDIESWRYAIRKYCGIPEPDLNAQHALDVYVFMSQGYHEYGIEWDARAVNLGPIREETRRIVEEERAKREALWREDSGRTNAAERETDTDARTRQPSEGPRVTNRPTAQFATSIPAAQSGHNWWIILFVGALAAGGFALLRRRGSGTGGQ